MVPRQDPSDRRRSPSFESTSLKIVGLANREKMLPFGGQGSNQAVEDAGALRCLFNNIDTSEGLAKRFDLFEKVRKSRVSRAQVLSKVRVGREQEVKEELLQYADPPGSCTHLHHRARY